ncbi:RsmD family RNA methyltransferase [soil metagenome]|nr:RsmD family RNA methyltransferase [Trueperaceae bacterium]
MARPRILGGTAKGRELETPRRGTRPSPSRLREALFDILAFDERGHFLDLYAGSGAIGLEAASRGWQAVCVDRSRAAVRVIESNAARLGLTVEVVAGDAIAAAEARPAAVDVLFAAPPYPLDLPPLFARLLASGAVRPGGRYVFQHPTSLTLALERSHARVDADVRRYGSNALTLVRA